MGPVSASLIVASALLVLVTWKSPDRNVPALACYVALDLAASLLVHRSVHGLGRASPLMVVDAAGFYIMGLMAVCRYDRPLWLHALCAATGLECVAHIAYLAGGIVGDQHTLALNILFAAQVASLVWGRFCKPEDDLHALLRDELGAAA